MIKIIIGLVVAIGVIIVGNIILPVPRAAIEVAAEPIGLGPVLTNALLTSIILSLIIIIVAFFVGRGLKERPGGLQNIIEMLIEALDGLVTNTASKKWAPTFFPIVATIFIWLLFANYFSLLTPLLGSFGIIHATNHGGIPVSEVTFISGNPEHLTPLHEAEAGEEGQAEGEAHGAQQQVIIVPLFRAPSSDLNLTFALAITTMILVQIFGLWERGLGYIGHFIRLDGFAKKGLGMGLIDFFLGLVELISEVAKILSFSFRLFGNIFAGEVLMIVIISLVSLLVLVLIFGLEIFVGTIQAFVFFILALVFFSIATQHHEEEH
jgi:F-type H+-transporting ATPase subunit a